MTPYPLIQFPMILLSNVVTKKREHFIILQWYFPGVGSVTDYLCHDGNS